MEYEKLEKNYNKTKEEAQEALVKLELCKSQFQESKKSFNILNHEYSHTNEILREHNETIEGYMMKVK